MKRPCPGDFPDRGVFVYQIKVSEQVGGEEQKRCGGYTVRAILVFADGSRTPTSPAVDGAILIFTNLAGMQAETGVDRAVLILADSEMCIRDRSSTIRWCPTAAATATSTSSCPPATASISAQMLRACPA